MSRSHLVQLDDDAVGEIDPILLPEGVTVFGRGPFLRVSDKRVSRNHGVLENLDGRFRIKPTHLNPCFCQSSLNDPPKALERNQWHTLEEGAIFSLLPGKYIYRVAAVGEEDSAPRGGGGRRRGEPQEEDQKSPYQNELRIRGVEPHGSKGASNPTQPKDQRRTPCPYGKDCYRKNPLHFQESSHPGDSDYEDEVLEEEDVDLPECPYGTDCYRKNPAHRKEYKHTKPVRRARATLNKEEDEDDDCDDEDTFINDDSENMEEDSDYVPPDSDDSVEEDIKRLQKEAKAFVNKRK
ncbi:aprataxin and PNK-like factor [Aplochiton taeniatus]